MNVSQDNKTALDDELRALRAFIPLRSLASLLDCHVATVYRWTSRGVRRVKLRFLQRGATRVTKSEWVEEFFDELTRLSLDPNSSVQALGRELYLSLSVPTHHG